MREERRAEKLKAQEAKGHKGAKAYNRGEDEEEQNFVSAAPFTKAYNNNNLTEWTTSSKAAEIWLEIEGAGQSLPEIALMPERDEDKKKFFLVNDDKGLKIKVKFNENPESSNLKIQFFKKSGDLKDFYTVLKEMQEIVGESLEEEA